MGFVFFSKIGMFAWNHKRKKKDIILREMYSDTLDTDISLDVPVSRPALLSRKTFDVPVCRLDTKALNALVIFHHLIHSQKSFATLLDNSL